MKLSLNIIRERLAGSYQVRQFGGDHQALSLKRPLYYEPGSMMKTGELYLAGVNTLPVQTGPDGVALICVGGRVPLEWMTSGAWILLVTGGGDAPAVFNDVQRIFDRFDDWERELLAETGKAEGIDLKRIVYLGVSMLENPCYVIDYTLQVILSSKLEPGIFVDDTPYSLPVDEREHLKGSDQEQRLLKKPFASSISGGEHGTYCQNLYLFDRFMGSVWFEDGHRPFRDSDYAIADYFFSYFVKAFRQHLRDFRAADLPGSGALEKILRHLPLEEGDHELFTPGKGEGWICFKLKNGRKSLPADFMCSTLNAMLPGRVLTTIHHREIVGLLSMGVREGEGQGPLDLLEDLVRRMGYFGGAGGEFRELQGFDDSYLQACYAAECGGEDGGEKPLRFFRDHMLDYMLHECSGKLAPESLYPRGLLALLESDRTRNTEYVRTLYTYLQNEMRIPETSEALYIHRNSFLKRMERIERLLEEDLGDPGVRLHYRLCFALMKRGYGGGAEETHIDLSRVL